MHAYRGQTFFHLKKKIILNCPQMSTFLICSTLAVAEYRVKRPIWIKNKPEPVKHLTFLSFFFVLVSPKPQMHKKKTKKKCCHQSSEYAHLFTGYILQMSARRIAYFYHNQSDSLLNDWKCHLSSHWMITSFRKGPRFFYPAEEVRHLNKHSSMNSFAKSGWVERSIKGFRIWKFHSEIYRQD